MPKILSIDVPVRDRIVSWYFALNGLPVVVDKNVSNENIAPDSDFPSKGKWFIPARTVPL
jgi:hypothetical protein